MSIFPLVMAFKILSKMQHGESIVANEQQTVGERIDTLFDDYQTKLSWGEDLRILF